jgi:hypothetical protein
MVRRETPNLVRLGMPGLPVSEGQNHSPDATRPPPANAGFSYQELVGVEKDDPLARRGQLGDRRNVAALHLEGDPYDARSAAPELPKRNSLRS